MLYLIFYLTGSLWAHYVQGRCPQNWTPASAYCYWLSPSSELSWQQAEDACAQSGGYLPIVTSPQEQEAFSDFRRNLPIQGNPFWLGLRAESDKWAWLQPEGHADLVPDTGKWNPWKGGVTPTPKKGYCVSIDNNSHWASYPCIMPLRFVCETGPVHDGTKVPNAKPSASTVRHWKRLVHLTNTRVVPSNRVQVLPVITRASAIQCAVECGMDDACVLFNFLQTEGRCELVRSSSGNEAALTSVAVSKVGWAIWERVGVTVTP